MASPDNLQNLLGDGQFYSVYIVTDIDSFQFIANKAELLGILTGSPTLLGNGSVIWLAHPDKIEYLHAEAVIIEGEDDDDDDDDDEYIYAHPPSLGDYYGRN